jgi:acetyl-CoA C-acetyltransferase
MTDVVVIDAVRTPIGRRDGGLSGMHPAQLLGEVQRELVARTGVDPTAIGQVIGGCVDQVGEQTQNVTRTAWLSAGLPMAVAATTVDTQCGSSQQATALAAALVGSGAVDVAMGCGVESMSRIPMGSTTHHGFGQPLPPGYDQHYEETTQFEGAERIADRWGITRRDAEELGVLSQQRAHAAWSRQRFDRQVVPIDAPLPEGDGDGTRRVERDEGLRETSLEALAGLKPVARRDGVHTAGTSSQISDGASAVLLTTPERAAELGLEPMARIVDTCLVGSDPELMLTGPIPATRALLERNGMTMDDIDLVEINEAFASVVLAWQRELDADMDRVNVNGGAIALGHPLGATGGVLIAKAVHELQRADRETALITMCCGGGLGTGMVLERV